MNIDFEALTGRSIHRLVQFKESVWIHESVIDDFKDLQKRCLTQDIQLEIASGFRGYERQKLIWEEKVRGERGLYDREENLIDVHTASESEILEALLAWSAIPGSSRHHWGTDLDLFDVADFGAGQKLHLKLDEYFDDDGPCFRMNQFLESCQDLKFFRPYENESQGIQPEPWHYSHTQTAQRYQTLYTKEVFKKNLEADDFSFAKEILENIDRYFSVYGP